MLALNSLIPRLTSSCECQLAHKDVIKIRNCDRFCKLVETNIEYLSWANLPSHLEFDKAALTGKVNGVIERESIALQIK